MVRVLHLLDADADFQTERGASSLARALGANFSVDTRRLGRGGYRNRAAAVLALRGETDFDLVHAWGPGALTTAAMASHRPIVYSPPPETRRRDVSWARAIRRHLMNMPPAQAIKSLLEVMSKQKSNEALLAGMRVS